MLTWFLHHADEPALPSPVSKLGQLNDGGTEEFASVWLKWEVKPGGRRRRGSAALPISRAASACFLPRLAWWRSTCNTSQRPWLPQLSRQMKSTFREGEVKEEAVDGREGGGGAPQGKERSFSCFARRGLRLRRGWITGDAPSYRCALLLCQTQAGRSLFFSERVEAGMILNSWTGSRLGSFEI